MKIGKWLKPASDRPRMPLLKKLFWIYFLLLIFEGALRKWIVPGFSAPLLVIRDPIGMLILFEAFRTNKWPERWSVTIGLLTAGFLALSVMQVAVYSNPWVAALYGLRSDLLPFPVAFVMGENLDAEDLRRFGLCTLWLMLPEAALDAMQYVAPTNSILNAGAYAEGTQIGYVGAHVRASGTFSFVVGPALFGPMTVVFVLYGLVHKWFAQRWLLWAAAFAVILSMPVTGSRAFVYEVAAVIACGAVAAAMGVTEFLKASRVIVPLVLVFILASFLPVFSESSASFGERFRGANEVEGGGSVETAIFNRTIGPYVTRMQETDFGSNPLGRGMGIGSNAVMTLLHGQAKRGEAEFDAGESAFDRAMIELGPIPGLVFTVFRIGLALTLLVKSVLRARAGEPLALLFAPLMATAVIFGVLEQPTGQGFMVIFLAFTIAALKFTSVAVRPGDESQRQPRPLAYSSPATSALGRTSG